MTKKNKKRKKKRGPTPPKRKIVDEHGNLIRKEKVQPRLPTGITSIPKILRGEFDYESNNIARYEEMLAQRAPRDRKLRILMTNEATFLHTGFSKYGYELFKRLHATGKYDLAEIGSYGGPANMEPRAANLPWKYYHVMFTNQVEQQEFQSDPCNQFGKWKLTYALADFKPDVVMGIRDWWMDEHVLKNPLRNKFHFIWMPTVDGYPQDWQWIKDYEDVDTLLTYSCFGKKVLETQSAWQLARSKGIKKTLKVTDVCQPGVDLEVFRPLPPGEAKTKFNIPQHFRFCGTVMRNQPRKLLPRIIEAFSEFKQKYPQESNNVNLLLHTSIPDVGWKNGAGIIETIERQGVANHVFFSYICGECRHMSISTFMGSPIQCPRCGRGPNPDGSGGFRTPNTQVGYDPEHFNFIYNILEVYIQGSIAEGDGMPINEAKAAGVPVLCSDYSAMGEKARNGGALPINNESIFNEPSEGCKQCGYTVGGTMQWRSHFSRSDLAKKLALLFGNEPKRRIMAEQARECAEKYYDWNLTALKWQNILDSIDIKDRDGTWETTEMVRKPTEEAAPDNLSDEDWLTWCYQNILRRTGVDNDGKKVWLGQLQMGATRRQLEAHFRDLMKDNVRVAEVLEDPEKAGMDPMQRIAKEIAEFEESRRNDDQE